MQPYHLLRVASVSKPITALAIMKLVEQGRLSLAGKVFGPQGYLRSPYYTRAITDQRMYDITVQQLLEHTAGWDRLVGCDGYAGCDPVDFPLHVAQALKAPTPVADSTLVRFLVSKGLNFAPGTRYAYSNVGYLVLGKIVEAVTGQPYEAWVRHNLLVPAGALEAHLGYSKLSSRLEREAAYASHYDMLACDGSGKAVPAAYGGFNLEAMGAHGGWAFSARDLVRLQLATAGSADRPGLLTPATLAAMVQPSAVGAGYAKGWQVNSAGHRWHGGDFDGTAAYLVHTAGDVTWAILLNARPSAPEFWDELDRLGWVGGQNSAVWPAHNLLAPAQNATNLTATEDSAGVLLRWTRGTGTRRLVLLQADKPITSFPLDGSRYPVASLDQISSLGQGTLVVANETADSVCLRKLDLSRTYYVRVVEYADNAATGFQAIYTLDGNPTLRLHAPAPELSYAASSAPTLDLYPNPARDQLHIAGLSFAMAYEVLTQQGRQVQSGLLTAGRPISIGDLVPGAYIIRVQTANRNVFQRFVKE
jgi:CubicO group peptidase (beta-lactamase class C family)